MKKLIIEAARRTKGRVTVEEMWTVHRAVGLVVDTDDDRGVYLVAYVWKWEVAVKVR